MKRRGTVWDWHARWRTVGPVELWTQLSFRCMVLAVLV